MIEKIPVEPIKIKALDQIPKGVPDHIYDKVLKLSQSKTHGLAYELTLKPGARVMLTSNLDIADKLINGQIGTISHITWNNGKVETVYVRFDDINAGQNKKATDPIARQHDAVPIEKITTEIKTIPKKKLHLS